MDHAGAKLGEQGPGASTSLLLKLSQFPILFARAVGFGRRRSHLNPGTLNTASVTLVDLGRGPMAITCSHVLAEYRRVRDSGEPVFFQIANVTLDPDAQVIAESTDLDLATIHLSLQQATMLRDDGVVGASIFQPAAWPPNPINENDVVALGGFPGSWREAVALNEIRSNSYSIGATAVSSVAEDHFACRFERDRWVWASRVHTLGDVNDLGGLSGGPVFALRGFRYDLVGIIYEFSRDFDILFLRPAHLIHVDGRIGL